MNEKLKMPPPEERRVIPSSDATHPAFGSSSPLVRQLPGPIQPAAEAKPVTVAITYIPAPGMEDDAPNGIFWATDKGIVLSPSIQEPMRMEHMPEGGETEGEEKDERPEDARPED